jgi:hypothetical protein
MRHPRQYYACDPSHAHTIPRTGSSVKYLFDIMSPELAVMVSAVHARSSVRTIRASETPRQLQQEAIRIQDPRLWEPTNSPRFRRMEVVPSRESRAILQRTESRTSAFGASTSIETTTSWHQRPRHTQTGGTLRIYRALCGSSKDPLPEKVLNIRKLERKPDSFTGDYETLATRVRSGDISPWHPRRLDLS